MTLEEGYTYGLEGEPKTQDPPRRAIGEPREPSPTELAYAAGMIDGEGCIHITKGPSFRLYLKVTMCHEETIVFLHKLFNRGSVQNAPQRIYTEAFSWLCSTRNAIEVIRLVRPMLITKAIEADIAEEFMRLPLAPMGGSPTRGKQIPPELSAARYDCWDRMRRAKSRFKFREDA